MGWRQERRAEILLRQVRVSLQQVSERLERIQRIQMGLPLEPPPKTPPLLVRIFAALIDFALEPDAAEAATGNLLEHMQRRRSRGNTYLIWYMGVQTTWILVNRAFDLIARFTRARAGR